MGWELFSQYVRALKEAKPKYFIYENNKSMSKQIRASIDEAFGFEAVLINSALVSAQNRHRLYWVGRRNEDGTYSKVDVEQPEDRGIFLKDVLDSAVARDLTSNDKAYTLTASYDGACPWNTIERHQRNMVAEPISYCTDKNVEHLMRNFGSKGKIVDGESKTPTLMAASGMGGGNHIYYADSIAEPVRGMGNDTKSRTLTANYWKTNVRDAFVDCAGGRTMVAEPINVTADGKSQTLKAQYCKNSVANFCCYSSTYGASGVAEPVACRCRGRVDASGNGYAKYECREDGKSNTLDTNTTNGAMVAEPVCVAERGRMYCGQPQHYEARTDGKTNTLTSGKRTTELPSLSMCRTIAMWLLRRTPFDVSGETKNTVPYKVVM